MAYFEVQAGFDQGTHEPAASPAVAIFTILSAGVLQVRHLSEGSVEKTATVVVTPETPLL